MLTPTLIETHGPYFDEREAVAEDTVLAEIEWHLDQALRLHAQNTLSFCDDDFGGVEKVAWGVSVARDNIRDAIEYEDGTYEPAISDQECTNRALRFWLAKMDHRNCRTLFQAAERLFGLDEASRRARS